MQDSSWRKSAVTFIAVVVVLAIVLFGGLYALKHRHDNSDHKKPSTTTSKSKDKSKKTSKNNKKSSQSENKKTESSASSNPSSSQASSQSPGEVAAAGPSDYWYVPILGLATLAFVGYEYYISRQALKQSIPNR